MFILRNQMCGPVPVMPCNTRWGGQRSHGVWRQRRDHRAGNLGHRVRCEQRMQLSQPESLLWIADWHLLSIWKWHGHRRGGLGVRGLCCWSCCSSDRMPWNLVCVGCWSRGWSRQRITVMITKIFAWLWSCYDLFVDSLECSIWSISCEAGGPPFGNYNTNLLRQLSS